jgi:hypothetical protein
MGRLPFKGKELMNGLVWFTQTFAPLMALGTIGAYAMVRRHRDALTLSLMLWSILGLGIILFQRLSWWEYHYLLLFVPLGILGAQGVDSLWSHLERLGASNAPSYSRLVGVLSLILLFSSVADSLARQGLYLARNGFALSWEDRFNYQTSVNSGYQSVHEEVAFLKEPGSVPGDIYVFGDPLYYYLSGRDPAIPLLATWFTALPEQWLELLDALDEARPHYVFVATGALDGIRSYNPRVAPCLDQTMPRIERNYRILRTGENGTWYVLRDR